MTQDGSGIRARIDFRANKAGMQAAQRRGRTLGRPRALAKSQELTVQRLALCDEIPLAPIANRMKVSMTTVWRAVAKVRPMTRAIRADS